jgi:hypothetical protein
MDATPLEQAISVGTGYTEACHIDNLNLKFATFISIIQLVNDSSEYKAEQFEECYYTYDDIAERLLINGRNKYDPGSIGRHIKTIENTFEKDFKPTLLDIAAKQGFDYIPHIEVKRRVGKGNQATVKIVPLAINETSSAELPDHKIVNQKSTETDIEYIERPAPPLTPPARWLQRKETNINHHRWLLFFTITPIFAIVFLMLQAALSWFNINLIQNGWILYSLILYVLFFAIFFSFLITALNNNIALLPTWTLPLRLQAAVLEYKISQNRAEGLRVKGVNIKTYEGKCPICGYRVFLGRSNIWRPNNIIGICDGNPANHRYTFDFTTRKGTQIN